MSIDRAVLAFAGVIILISLGLSQIHHPYWLWLTAVVGANMLQSAFTGFCPLAKIFKAFGLPPGLLRVWETYFSAAVGTVLALLYTAIVAFAVPGARSQHSALYLALALFCINGLGFGLAALTPLSPRYAIIKRFYKQYGRPIVIADMQLTMVLLAFLWLGVVGAI